MKRKRSRQLKTIAIVTGCLLLSPLIVPYLLIEHANADRRRKRNAKTFHCVQCGHLLGEAAIAKADRFCLDHVRELHHQFPHSRFRLVRNVWAICTECGARYNYLGNEQTYVLLPETDSDAVGRDN